MGFSAVQVLGRLTKNPELKTTNSGHLVLDFCLAINRQYKKNNEKVKETVFVDIVAWGKIAEIIVQYCQKGQQIFISGRLHLKQWQDKVTGGNRSKLLVVCENFRFVGNSGAQKLSDKPNAPDSDWTSPLNDINDIDDCNNDHRNLKIGIVDDPLN